MTKPHDPIATEIGTIGHAYDALNTGDIAGFMDLFAPDVERFESFGIPQARIYRGTEEVRAHVEQGRAAWAEGGCEPKAFTVVGDWVFVSVSVRVRLKAESEWREGEVVDVFKFRDSKATRFASFLDETAAFKWAGISGSDQH